MLNYILQVSISWTAFYLIYWLFLRRETFFQLNRFYLLATLIISLAIPYIQLPSAASETLPIAQVNLIALDIYTAPIAGGVQETEELGSSFNWVNIIWIAYGFVAFALLCKFLLNIAQIQNLYSSGSKKRNKDYYLVENDLLHIPFSFLNYLFFSKKMEVLPEEKRHIIEHEEAHIKQWHSIDVLIVEVLQILFWFNPFIFLYKRAIKENHEYLADHAVLRHTSKKKYGRLLLGQSDPGIRIALANNFNYSQLKNRIVMMTRQQSSGRARYKLLLAVPVLLMATILFANRSTLNDASTTEAVAISMNDFNEKDIRLKLLNTLWNMKLERIRGYKNGENRDVSAAFRFDKSYNELIKTHPKQIKAIQDIASELAERYDFSVTFQNDKIQKAYFKIPVEEVIINLPKGEDGTYTSVEEMPTFGKCEDGKLSNKCSHKNLAQYISKNLKYPAFARENNVQGYATISFVVEADGSVNRAKIVSDPGMGTGEEALRVIEGMPRWKAGKQKGKAVPVSYFIPVEFRLKGVEGFPSKSHLRKPEAPPVFNEKMPEAPTAPATPPPPPPPPPAFNAPAPPPPPPPVVTKELIEAQKLMNDEVFMLVEEMPYMKGCEALDNKQERKKCSDTKILNFIRENLVYPAEARKKGLQGTAVVQFTIEKDGSITGIKSVRSIGEELDRAAQNIVALMPNWVSGKQGGKNVRVQFNLPIRFRLQGSSKPAPNKNYVSKLLKLTDFNLSPNPTNGLMRINFNAPSQSDITLRVVDLTGKTIWTSTENSFSGSMNKEVQISAPSGSYYLTVEQDGKTTAKPFVIQK